MVRSFAFRPLPLDPATPLSSFLRLASVLPRGFFHGLVVSFSRPRFRPIPQRRLVLVTEFPTFAENLLCQRRTITKLATLQVHGGRYDRKCEENDGRTDIVFEKSPSPRRRELYSTFAPRIFFQDEGEKLRQVFLQMPTNRFTKHRNRLGHSWYLSSSSIRVPAPALSTPPNSPRYSFKEVTPLGFPQRLKRPDWHSRTVNSADRCDAPRHWTVSDQSVNDSRLSEEIVHYVTILPSQRRARNLRVLKSLSGHRGA